MRAEPPPRVHTQPFPAPAPVASSGLSLNSYSTGETSPDPFIQDKACCAALCQGPGGYTLHLQHWDEILLFDGFLSSCVSCWTGSPVKAGMRLLLCWPRHCRLSSAHWARSRVHLCTLGMWWGLPPTNARPSGNGTVVFT